jgi:hypothetical protein
MTYPVVSFRVLLASVISLAVAAPSWASPLSPLVITGGNATVAAGGVGSVDFMISSSGTTSYNLATFGLQVQVTPVAPTSSFLQFSSSQPDPFTDSRYVFTHNSFDQDFGLPFWGSPSSTVTFHDTVAGGDGTDTTPYVKVTPTSNFLLATVQFEAPAGASAGDSFTISLVSDPNQTYFNDDQGHSIVYTSTPATVTVAPAQVAAAPEPSSLVLAGVSGLAGLLSCRRGRRKA